MNDCRKARALFADALFSEKQEQQPWLTKHLNECADCAGEFQHLSGTINFMQHRERKDPGPQFWNSYWDRLQPRLQKPVPQPFFVRNRWMLQAAAAVVLVFIGVLIGKTYFRPSNNMAQQGAQGPRSTVPATAVTPVNYETQRFLERSEVLLLGVIHTEQPAEDSSVDLSREKQVSRELVHQASTLKKELNNPDQQQLRRLVSDLEVILIQIANLEEKNDFPEVKLVKDGVDRKAILLKINLEQMKMSQNISEAPAQRQKQSRGKQKI